MKKLFLLLITSSYLFSMDILVGFGYGYMSATSKLNGTKYESTDVQNKQIKAGVDLGESRILVTIDEPDMKDGEDLKVTTLSWHAIDKPGKFMKGFFGLGYSEFDYSNKALSIDETKNAYGVELGLILLEEGNIYENIEMEFGYRHFITKSLSQSGSFELEDFNHYYMGFNYLF